MVTMGSVSIGLWLAHAVGMRIVVTIMHYFEPSPGNFKAADRNGSE